MTFIKWYISLNNDLISTTKKATVFIQVTLWFKHDITAPYKKNIALPQNYTTTPNLQYRKWSIYEWQGHFIYRMAILILGIECQTPNI